MDVLTNHATRTAVSVTGLRKAYGEKVALDGVDLSIGEGEVFALLGPNGAGKTTTVQILSTLIPGDAGTASVIGHELRGEAGAVRAVIGVTGQFSAVDNLLTGEENLLLMGRLLHLTAAERRARAAHCADDPPASSGGPDRTSRCRRGSRSFRTRDLGHRRTGVRNRSARTGLRWLARDAPDRSSGHAPSQRAAVVCRLGI